MVEMKWKAVPGRNDAFVGEMDSVMLPGGGTKTGFVMVTQAVAVTEGSWVEDTVI